MAHIADLCNNGRCGLHQTLDQARHGYAQLIAKEQKAADQAYIRRRLQQMGVRCPVCKAPATAYKCVTCGHFPVILPELLPPAVDVRQMSPTPSMTSERRVRLEQRLEELEKVVSQERQERQHVLDQIASVKRLLEAANRRKEVS